MASARTITNRVIRMSALLICAFIAQWFVAWGCVLAARAGPPLAAMKTADVVPREVLAEWEAEFADGGGRIVYARSFEEARTMWDESVGNSSRVGSQVFVVQGLPVERPGYTQWTVLDQGRPTIVSMSATWAGWPMRSLKMRQSTMGGVSMTYVDCMRFGTLERWLGTTYPCMLPTQPLWPGALANVVVFAGMWLVLQRGWHEARRWRRRSRGRCPECGYVLREADTQDIVRCPECGTRSVMRLPRD